MKVSSLFRSFFFFGLISLFLVESRKYKETFMGVAKHLCERMTGKDTNSMEETRCGGRRKSFVKAVCEEVWMTIEKIKEREQ